MGESKMMVLTEPEMALLYGLPIFAQALYMQLRWRMNFATGRVGDQVSISYRALAEALYVEPKRGRHKDDCGTPTVSKVREALDRLKEVGLIVALGGDLLVFSLPKAHRKFARPIDEQQVSSRGEQQVSSTVKTHENQGDNHNVDGLEQQGVNGDEQHTSGKGVNTIRTQAASTTSASVDKLSTGLLLSLPLTGEKVAQYLRLREQGRTGKRLKASAKDEAISRMLADGLTPQALESAYEHAVMQREVRKSTALVNPGFVACIFRDQRVEEVCRGAAPGRGHWSASPDGLRAMAERLGLDPQRGDEGLSQFRGRVMFEAGNRALEGAG